MARMLDVSSDLQLHGVVGNKYTSDRGIQSYIVQVGKCIFMSRIMLYSTVTH